MSERRKRPEPLSRVELAWLITKLLEPPPYEEKVLRLKAQLAAWEAEQDRLRDPVGHLCKALAKKVPDVQFRDRSPFDRAEGRISMSIHRPGRHVPEPSTSSLDRGATDGRTTMKTRWQPERTLADEVGISRDMLVNDPDTLEDILEKRARRLLETSP